MYITTYDIVTPPTAGIATDTVTVASVHRSRAAAIKELGSLKSGTSLTWSAARSTTGGRVLAAAVSGGRRSDRRDPRPGEEVSIWHNLSQPEFIRPLRQTRNGL